MWRDCGASTYLNMMTLLSKLSTNRLYWNLNFADNLIRLRRLEKILDHLESESHVIFISVCTYRMIALDILSRFTEDDKNPGTLKYIKQEIGLLGKLL